MTQSFDHGLDGLKDYTENPCHPLMPGDILDTPRVRSVKMMGTYDTEVCITD